MKKLIVFLFIFVLFFSFADNAAASPADPGFFERVSEWFGNIFTFGDYAKAARDISKAEAIFADIEANPSASPEFKANGFERYFDRMFKAQERVWSVKNKGQDVSLLARRLKAVSESHLEKLEEHDITDEEKLLGIERALRVVKESNETAREAL